VLVSSCHWFVIKFHKESSKAGLVYGPALIARAVPLVMVTLENNPNISMPSCSGMFDKLSPANEVALTTQSVNA
jgi:hypothetical protein